MAKKYNQHTAHWHGAIDHPEIRRRLNWFGDRLGEVPPCIFLICVLDWWDSADNQDKANRLIEAFDIDFDEPNGCYNKTFSTTPVK